jgi:hypothetical protein
MRNAYKFLLGKFIRYILLNRSRANWQDNIKIYLKVAGWEIVNSVHLTENRDPWFVAANTVTIPGVICVYVYCHVLGLGVTNNNGLWNG